MTQTPTRLPRGIRNNNPGNINFAHQPGAVLETTPPGETPRFAHFPTPEAGLEAMCNLLIRYMTTGGKHTVRAIIDTWAPPSENDTDSYVQGVAHTMGVGPDEPLTPTPRVLTLLMNAIIHRENGINPYKGQVSLVAANARCAPTGHTEV